MRCNAHHKALDENGVGKCSVPMWCNGMPAGFCDEPAYGNRPEGRSYVDASGRRCRLDGRYAGYMSGLACPSHGGPPAPSQKESDNEGSA